MKYGGCIYILTNKHHTVLYIGVTSDLSKRYTNIGIKDFQQALLQNTIVMNLFIMKTLLELKKQLQEKSKLKVEAEKRKRL